jgi:hypothetical protein
MDMRYHPRDEEYTSPDVFHGAPGKIASQRGLRAGETRGGDRCIDRPIPDFAFRLNPG